MKRVAVFVLPFVAVLSVLGITLLVSRSQPFTFRRSALRTEGAIEEAPE